MRTLANPEVFWYSTVQGVHPDEAVALGAPYAATLSDESVDGPLLIDVTPFDLGIDIAGGLFEKIIQRYIVPRFTSLQQAGQNHRLVIRQGKSRIAKENELQVYFRCQVLQLQTQDWQVLK